MAEGVQRQAKLCGPLSFFGAFVLLVSVPRNSAHAGMAGMLCHQRFRKSGISKLLSGLETAVREERGFFSSCNFTFGAFGNLYPPRMLTGGWWD